MYTIRPCSVKEFLNDSQIQLPRFQRKQTWDEKKNFQLVISIFKQYPMGVCIISNQRVGKREVKYLLDGRQRRNVFKVMFDNPDEISKWARSFIGYKNNVDLNDLKDLFDEKINDYLEDDQFEPNTTEDHEDNEVEEFLDGLEGGDGLDRAAEDDYGTGLDLLFKIISTFYKKSKHYTGFSQPFDFYNWLEDVPYIDLDENNQYVLNGTKLKTFIDEYRKHCENNSKEYDESADVFSEFLLQRCSRFKVSQTVSQEKQKQKLIKTIKDRWNDILLRINLVDRLSIVLSDAKIGIIEVSEITSSDSQKIFNIINSEGVKLTAAEVLSASAGWNVKINNPSAEMLAAAKDLYDQMSIRGIQDVVRWDIPATLLSRIGKNIVFKELSWDSKANKTEFEKKLTLGFKCFAGVFEKGIKKDDIEKMGKDPTISWEQESESLLSDLKTVLKIINDMPYFKYLNSWNTTIMEMTSDTIALDFLLIMRLDWIRKGKPLGNSTQTSKFQKNAVVLLDRLIYEYINLQWRGSSDSKVAKNIESLGKSDYPDMFVPVTAEDWVNTLTEIKDKLRVSSNAPISYAAMKPILYHAYCLMEISGPGSDPKVSIEVDHIIPQSVFKSSLIANNELIKDSVYNLGLLPKKENISKSDQRLRDITDPWLRDQIVKYEFVPVNRFEEFSNISNYATLFDLRKAAFFDVAFGEKRKDLLNN